MVRVWIPSPLRDLFGGATTVEVPGGTVGEVFRELDARAPGFYERVVEDDRVRPELAIAINGEAGNVPLFQAVPEGAEIAIIPAISGG